MIALDAGTALIHEGRLTAALHYFEAALAAEPDCAEAHFALGQISYLQREIERSLASFSRAWELGIDLDRGAQERWMALMLLGHFEDAWIESDRVLHHRSSAGITCTDQPLHCRFVWDGSPLDCERLLVRCYHGLGDTLQFIRYVPLLKQRAARVIVQAQPELIPLLQSMREIDELVPLGEVEPDYDVAIESMELPHAFRTTPATIPAAMPYLHVRSARSPLESRRLRVGLVWTAGGWKPERSIPAAELSVLTSALTSVPGVSIFSLQRGLARKDLPTLALAGELGSDEILDTAAAIGSLDLIITVDTMVPHLAGALGKPVWTLLHFHSDWRWMLHRDDSPWYPTMRLFRQPSPGDWNPVISEVRAALESGFPLSIPLNSKGW